MYIIGYCNLQSVHFEMKIYLTDWFTTVAHNCQGQFQFGHDKINLATAKSIWPRQYQFTHVSFMTQGSYRSWKTWKVMEFRYFSFQAWKVMEFNCWLWKGMENYNVCGTEIIAGVDLQGQNKIQASYVRRYPKTRTIFESGR